MHIKLDGDSYVTKRQDGSAEIAYMGGTVWVPKSISDGLKAGPAKDLVLVVSLYGVTKQNGKPAVAVRFG